MRFGRVAATDGDGHLEHRAHRDRAGGTAPVPRTSRVTTAERNQRGLGRRRIHLRSRPSRRPRTDIGWPERPAPSSRSAGCGRTAVARQREPCTSSRRRPATATGSSNRAGHVVRVRRRALARQRGRARAGRDGEQPVVDPVRTTATGSSRRPARVHAVRRRALLRRHEQGQALNGPIVGSIATPTGRGYYMVASDGGIFTFGDAHFYGSTGAHHAQPARDRSRADRRQSRLLARRLRRRHLHVRRRPLPRLDGRHAAEPAGHRHGPLRQRLPHGRLRRRHLRLLEPPVRRLARRRDPPAVPIVGVAATQ